MERGFSRRIEALAPYGQMSREALMKGAGFTREQLDRPFIGVVNGYGEIGPGGIHLDRVAKAVKAGITAAGGTPVEFYVSTTCVSMPHGGENYRWTMPWRDIVASYIEATTEINYFDGLVMVTVCDDGIPANLCAAARLGIPAIVMPGGCMRAAEWKGQHLDIVELTYKYGEVQSGRLSQEAFDQMHDCAVSGKGACGVMGTGNTGAVIAEALGLALPGAGTVPGDSEEIMEIGRSSGEQIMTLVRKGITTREIMTQEALENAIRVFLAAGGSTNQILHIAAIAYDAGLELSIDTFDRLSRETPFIVNCRPSGRYDISDLHDAGGVQAVMKELSPLLNLDALTVTGATVRDNLAKIQVSNRELIYPLDRPLQHEGGIAALKGNLASDGAIVKQVAVPHSMMRFRGKARVYSSEPAATKALVSGEIRAGDVVVVNYQGPKGDPGMRQTGALFANILVGMDLLDKVAFVTDGRLSGTNKGLLVAHVAPEAAVGGALAAVQDGDTIDIDVPGRRLSLLLPEKEIRRRLAECQPPPTVTRGFLAVYQRLVTQANEGCVLRP
ncbi:dihydroxy-acid dehydratase [Chloroflexota bacterium]